MASRPGERAMGIVSKEAAISDEEECIGSGKLSSRMARNG